MFKQFGAKPSTDDLKKYEDSIHWDKGKFTNLEVTDMSMAVSDIPKIFYNQYLKKGNRIPKRELDILALDVPLLHDKPTMQAVWFGHSVLLIQVDGLNILIDPMFGENAAPISPIGIHRFTKNTLSIIDTLPDLDLVLLSHDHYDHLDYASIQKLKFKTKKFVVALGVKRHLEKWGINSDKIIGVDWWKTISYKQLDISFTPTRHFSGRGLLDRHKSLWGGWVIASPKEKIWFSGDSGYGEHFKEIGERFGPFDFAFMECGQYSQFWPDIHMFPETSVQAALDAKVERVMPIHWAAFSLAQHDWTEPVERFLTEAEKQKISFLVPKLGQTFNLETELKNFWWEDY